MAGPVLCFEKFLGEGSFGSVSLFNYRGPRHDKTLYATAKTSDEDHADSLHREFRILSEFKGCPRIVQCYGTKVQERLNKEGCVEYTIHMEYARGGSLGSFANNLKERKLPDPLVRVFTRMLLEGLATIHGHGYVHCDLKPANILVFPTYVNKDGAWRSSYQLKISDFGLSRKDGDRSWWKRYRPYAGTPIYMSPESISHGETGKGLDLWSLGCVVLEMYTGKEPWWHKDEYDLDDLKNGYGPLIPRELPCDAKLFLLTCFSRKADGRKDAKTLLSHTFLQPPVNGKTATSRNITLELERNRQRLELERNRQRLWEMKCA